MAESSTPGLNDEDPVRRRLEADRRELLDLSLRNPLLNYRPRARGLEFLGESAAQVFRVLVSEGKRLAFLPAPGKTEAGPAAEDEGASRLSLNTTQTDLKLQTELHADILQARLLAIFHAARTAIEEQGVNTLFLVPGMLRWFEADDRERKRPLRAPLLLVPVELERSSARERFRLRASEEDPEVNLSLVAKLRADFHIDLPELSDPEADPDTPEAAERFLEAVALAVREQEGWEVDRSAIVLGFFSFGKFLMYRDLDEASWPADAQPCDHPIVRALLHEGFREPPSPAGDDEPLDGIIAPADLHQVVDADSTQLLAILDVSQGRNLLIQGPPGTGKSQTITNLIADALGSGKTVLFVAEKLAALEVVKRRLDAVGLGDACLELHSHKTRKKAVLDELRRTLGLGKPKLEPIDDDLKMLDAARQRLSAYCEAVNTPVGASGVTPYEAYGALLKLQVRPFGTPPPPLEMASMANWTSYDMKRRRALVEELQSRVAAIDVPRAHPFWGCKKGILLPTETDRLRELLVAAQTATAALRAAADPLAALLHLPLVKGRPDTERLLRAARRAAKAAQLTGADVASREWTERRGEIHELLDAGMKLVQLHQRHDDVLVPEAWDEDLRAVRQGLNDAGREWWRFVSPGYRRARRTLAGLCRAAPPRRLEEQLELVDAVLAARRQHEVIRRHEPLGARLFGSRWQGERSHWQALANLARWSWQLHHEVRTRRLPEGLIALLADLPPLEPLGPRLSCPVKDATGHAGSTSRSPRPLAGSSSTTRPSGSGPAPRSMPSRSPTWRLCCKPGPSGWATSRPWWGSTISPGAAVRTGWSAWSPSPRPGPTPRAAWSSSSSAAGTRACSRRRSPAGRHWPGSRAAGTSTRSAPSASSTAGCCGTTARGSPSSTGNGCRAMRGAVSSACSAVSSRRSRGTCRSGPSWPGRATPSARSSRCS